MTRRSLMLAAPAALAGGGPQTPEPPPLPKNGQEELQAALEQRHRAAAQLDKVAVPMATEPAFHFKA